MFPGLVEHPRQHTLEILVGYSLQHPNAALEVGRQVSADMHLELADQSANAIARELNTRQIATPSGKPWSAVTVLRVQRRLEGLLASRRR